MSQSEARCHQAPHKLQSCMWKNSVSKSCVWQSCVWESCAWKRCVCVCTICIDVKLHITAGGCWGTLQRPTKTLQCSCENVPALYKYIYIYIYSPAPVRIKAAAGGWGGHIFYRCCLIRSMSTVIIRLYIMLQIFILRVNLLLVFLHVRCIPHQNSPWLFWASVWFMLDSSWWHEPLGECFSKQESEFLIWSLNLHFST